MAVYDLGCDLGVPPGKVMDLHPPHEFTTPDDEDTNGTSDLRLTLTEAEADAPLCLPSRQSVQAS